MEEEAAYANDEVADKPHEKHRVVTAADAVGDTLVSQIHEREVCQGIYDLGRVNGGVVVLQPRSIDSLYWSG